MKLRSLLAGCSIRSSVGDLNTDIVGLAYDSRRVSAGFAFVAIRGTRADGNRFASQALANGAVAVVSASEAPAEILDSTVWVQVGDDREVLAVLAANFYGHPTANLHLIGVTGTNGKTTTTYLIESILKSAGESAAIFGTIEYRGPGFGFPADRTTPEAPDVEQLFRRVVDAGWKYSVMEVSSHAIALKRVAALHFEVAVFTNLSRDHLDFHGDMRAYFLTKKKLFIGMNAGMPRMMVLNRDDAHFEELREIDPRRVISYGIGNAAGIHPVVQRFTWEGTEAVFRTPVGDVEVRSRLMGTPNLYNIGAAIGVAVVLGLPTEAVREGIESLPSVPGRFEAVFAGQPFRVIVDYAHTDDALEKALRSAREITPGRVIVVFGCGGDRDRTKRPLMGEVAGQWADYVVVTSDNPRSEDPEAIIGEVEEGLKRTGANYQTVVARRDGIGAALRAAQPGDTVLIAGKGHEAYQTIGEQTFPFDDRAIARELIDELNTGRNQ